MRGRHPAAGFWSWHPAAHPVLDRAGQLMHEDRGAIRYAPVNKWGTLALRGEFSRPVAAIVIRRWPDVFDR